MAWRSQLAKSCRWSARCRDGSSAKPLCRSALARDFFLACTAEFARKRAPTWRGVRTLRKASAGRRAAAVAQAQSRFVGARLRAISFSHVRPSSRASALLHGVAFAPCEKLPLVGALMRWLMRKAVPQERACARILSRTHGRVRAQARSYMAWRSQLAKSCRWSARCRDGSSAKPLCRSALARDFFLACTAEFARKRAPTWRGVRTLRKASAGRRAAAVAQAQSRFVGARLRAISFSHVRPSSRASALLHGVAFAPCEKVPLVGAQMRWLKRKAAL